LDEGYDWDAFAEAERFDQNNLDFYRWLVADDTRYALHRYAELGIVRVLDEQEIVETTGESRRSGGRVELDRLGKVLVSRLLAEASGGPPIGSLKHLDAIDLLRAAADIPDGLAEAELDNWLASSDETAVERLIEAMVVVSPLERHGGYHALLRLGPELAPSCQQFEKAGLGDVALVFGVDTGLFRPEGFEMGNDPESWVGLVATVADLWGTDVAATGWAEQAVGAGGLTAMLEQAWRVGGEATETALGAVGSSHPDKLTAKAARKALFKFRSAG
jgi:hypothetical protein